MRFRYYFFGRTILYAMKTLVALLSVQAALITGTAYPTDIHLFGEIEEFGIFKITCFSCLKPYEESADFYINDVQVDAVRYSDGKCYHKRKLCDPIECTCSMEGNNFTLRVSSGLPFMEFSCEMRFKDEATSKLFVQTAHLIFNETEFIPEMQISRTIGFNEDTHTKIGTTDVNVIVSGDGQKSVETFNIVGWILVLVFALVISVLTCVFPNTPGKIFNWLLRCIDKPKDQQGYEPLKDNIMCATCDAILTCALCVDCRLYYCDLCCKHHKEMNTTHIMFQTQQIAVNQRKVNCRTCTKKAERFCTNCWNPFCTSCTKHPNCGKREIIIIYQAHSKCKPQNPVNVEDKLCKIYNASFQDDTSPVRVCGIAYLADKTVVVIDGNNWKLIAFKTREDQSCLDEKLKNEPNAITTMTGNAFAITYPYEKYIQIYDLTFNTTQHTYQVSEGEKICTKSEPFNIAYSQGRFAVEVGKREDGRIAIFDLEKHEFTKNIECNYAFFTGHTIRLALDKNQLFVSAMGKQMVSCMDIDGTKLWHRSVPSPRAIIVPQDYSEGEKIILASKRCNAIYELKKEQGNDEIVTASRNISSPRYMAYQGETKTLCILVQNDDCHEDELAFYQFKDAKPEESTSPPVEIEIESLIDH